MLKPKTNYASNWIVAIASVVLFFGLFDAVGFWIKFAGASDDTVAQAMAKNWPLAVAEDFESASGEDSVVAHEASSKPDKLAVLNDSDQVRSALSALVRFDDLPERFDFRKAAADSTYGSTSYGEFVIRDRNTRTIFEIRHISEPEGVTSPEDYIDKVAGMLSATSEKASRQTAGISMPYVIGTLANSAENGIFYGCLATGDDGLILFTVRCENFGQSLDRALLNVFFDHIDRISD